VRAECAFRERINMRLLALEGQRRSAFEIDLFLDIALQENFEHRAPLR